MYRAAISITLPFSPTLATRFPPVVSILFWKMAGSRQSRLFGPKTRLFGSVSSKLASPHCP